jgi:hypothetical protein
MCTPYLRLSLSKEESSFIKTLVPHLICEDCGQDLINEFAFGNFRSTESFSSDAYLEGSVPEILIFVLSLADDVDFVQSKTYQARIPFTNQ